MFKSTYCYASLSAVAFCFVVYEALLLFRDYSESKDFDRMIIQDERNFEQAPFDMLDATHFCMLKTQLRFGRELKQSYVDENSTRIDHDTGVYKVFMFAYLGSRAEQEEKSVHCFVDPHARVVTHYRSLDRYKTSLVSKALSFFK